MRSAGRERSSSAVLRKFDESPVPPPPTVSDKHRPNNGSSRGTNAAMREEGEKDNRYLESCLLDQVEVESRRRKLEEERRRSRWEKERANDDLEQRDLE